jgi:glycosyltransferase involved in cell wall biosynthesis
MRIAITMQSHDERWGGIGVYTRQIVRHLLEQDQSNEYVLIYPGFGSSRNAFGQYRAAYSNVTEVVTRRSIPWGSLWEQVVVPAECRRHDIDLLFNPFWSVPIVGDYKKVMVVHGVDSHVTPQALRLRGRFEWALHSKLWIHRADAVISISDTMSRDLERYVSLAPERIRRIYHGRSEVFRPIVDQARLAHARARYSLPEKYLLFVGMLFPQKNFTNLLHAFAHLAHLIPHQLLVVGRPRWKYSEELALIEELGLRARVRFLDHVDHEELPSLYSLADCFVFPSLYEAFGLVGLEAMACGCPVAAARTGALPEVLGDAALFFDPLDPVDMAAQIQSILFQPHLHASLKNKGLARAAGFTWERAARELLGVFRELVEGEASLQGTSHGARGAALVASGDNE